MAVWQRRVTAAASSESFARAMREARFGYNGGQRRGRTCDARAKFSRFVKALISMHKKKTSRSRRTPAFDETAQYKREAADLAAAVLAGRLHPLTGSQSLSRALSFADLHTTAEASLFFKVTMASLPLPIDEADRRNWACDALKKKDVEISALLAEHGHAIIEACKGVIEITAGGEEQKADKKASKKKPAKRKK